jgi:hypothetical protein
MAQKFLSEVPKNDHVGRNPKGWSEYIKQINFYFWP